MKPGQSNLMDREIMELQKSPLFRTFNKAQLDRLKLAFRAYQVSADKLALLERDATINKRIINKGK